MNAYLIRVNITESLYADYMVEAKDLLQAKHKAKKAFFRDYPGAETPISFSLDMPNSKTITEIMDIIKGERYKGEKYSGHN